MSSTICQNLQRINKRIESICNRVGRNRSDIQLIAISKTKPTADIRAALECGQIHFGENRARELEEKMDELKDQKIQWHFVGPMQTNKIKYMTDRVDWIHSVYKKKYFSEIEKRAGGSGRVINTLIQVNISGEKQKQGCFPEHLPDLLEHAKPMEYLRVCGLMGMASFTDDESRIRQEFRTLRETFQETSGNNGGAVQLEQLSMGMTHDMELAIEEGSTMLRIGTAIFGERNNP